MYLSSLTIQGYKNFGQKFEIEFSEGLNVLVGENSVGKTAIIDAIRHLIPEDDYRNPITESDFYCPFTNDGKRVDTLMVHGKFEGLSKSQIVAFLPWTDIDGNASLTFQVDNKPNNKGRYRSLLWGGASRSSMFEKELFDAIDCVYLPPLRDAQANLREGKSSRLARLLRNINKESLKKAKDEGKLHPLEEKVRNFNQELAADENESILKANNLIKDRLNQAIGGVFGQDTHIQFSETSFNRIVESLRLFFFPEIQQGVPIDAFRDLEENSLGYNNLLYIATVLAEITFSEEKSFYKTLLIEEPEAHLHPQLQVRLLKYLENTARINNVQVIVTTHSPVLASSVSIDSLIHLSRQKEDHEFIYTPVALKSCGLSGKSKEFLTRWLDVTKSTLLFARGVILVEGIAEAILIPEFSNSVLDQFNRQILKLLHTELSSFGLDKDAFQHIVERNFEVKADDFASNGSDIVEIIKSKFIEPNIRFLPSSLEDAGISVINMNGIYFKHFMPLFCNFNGIIGEYIPILCSGLTDNDPPKEIEGEPSKPTLTNLIQGNNPALDLCDEINKSNNTRLYPNSLKTFEYDLAMEADNRIVMLDILHGLWPTDGDVKKELEELKDKLVANDDEKAIISNKILKRIEDSNIGKGLFSQVLADKIKEGSAKIEIPMYIRKAIIWSCGGIINDT